MNAFETLHLHTMSLSPGTLINERYKINKILGSGGFAIVYAAHDLTIDRQVALKVLDLPSSLRDPKEKSRVLERFRTEATAAARIKNPYVPSVYDMGTIHQTQQPYIVMEYLSGRDLSEELQMNGPLSLERSIKFIIQLLDALTEAHKHGIIHKDLKPSNLFLVEPNTDNEKIYILDFGIARLGDNKNLTGTGQILGTVQYMSPEYLEHQTVTPSLDIYQTGLLLCEMLSGRPVVQDENQIACMMRHLRGTLEFPSSIILSPIGSIIKKATSFEIKDRYTSAKEFKQNLEIFYKNINNQKIKTLAEPLPAHILAPPEENLKNKLQSNSSKEDIKNQIQYQEKENNFNDQKNPTLIQNIPDLSTTISIKNYTFNKENNISNEIPNNLNTSKNYLKYWPLIFFISLVCLLSFFFLKNYYQQYSQNKSPFAIKLNNSSSQYKKNINPKESTTIIPPPPKNDSIDSVENIENDFIKKEEYQNDKDTLPSPLATDSQNSSSDQEVLVIKIYSEPSGATVIKGKSTLGVTPIEIKYQKTSDIEHSEPLIFKKFGYQKQTIQLTTQDIPQKTIFLKKNIQSTSKNQGLMPE
jgi:serine/threonine protein kinase